MYKPKLTIPPGPMQIKSAQLTHGPSSPISRWQPLHIPYSHFTL